VRGRIAGVIAIALGVLLVIAAPVVKWVVAPALVKAPLSVHQATVAVGDSQVFVLSAQAVRDVPVIATRTVTGDKSAGTSSVAVYDAVLCLRSRTTTRAVPDKDGCVPSTDPGFIQRTVDRIAFDRKSGLAVTDPGRYKTAVDGDAKIAHSGLGYTFPIGTRRTTYPFFDPVAGRAFDMAYVATSKVAGMTVYQFRQTVPATPIKINGLLPGTYTDVRTVWVEPTTGIVVKGAEQISQVFTSGGMTAFKGTLGFDQATVASQAAFAKSQLRQVHAIRQWVPLAALVIGLALLVLGVLLVRRRQLADVDGGTGQDPSTQR
jgi:hypothetical protein